jgi:flagellar hook protein FlgE
MAMDGISASVSGLNVTGQSLALSANNIANVNTDGYRAQSLRQQALPQGGVAAEGVQASQAPTEPGGSNVDLASELLNMNTQGAGYSADLKFLEVKQKMIGTALDMKA